VKKKIIKIVKSLPTGKLKIMGATIFLTNRKPNFFNHLGAKEKTLEANLRVVKAIPSGELSRVAKARMSGALMKLAKVITLDTLLRLAKEIISDALSRLVKLLVMVTNTIATIESRIAITIVQHSIIPQQTTMSKN